MPKIEDLIERFEKDIVYDCHGFYARFERSRAMRELFRMRRRVLISIIYHLRKNPPSDFMDLRTAWGYLFNWIQNRVDPEKTGPQKLIDTKGWIAWAEKFVI